MLMVKISKSILTRIASTILVKMNKLFGVLLNTFRRIFFIDRSFKKVTPLNGGLIKAPPETPRDSRGFRKVLCCWETLESLRRIIVVVSSVWCIIFKTINCLSDPFKNSSAEKKLAPKYTKNKHKKIYYNIKKIYTYNINIKKRHA